MADLVLGLGTGRCGTKSLAFLLNLQPEVYATHESRPLMPWLLDMERYPLKLDEMRARPESIVADVCFTYLPYVRWTFTQYGHSVKFICLQRGMRETVGSFMRWLDVGENFWARGGLSERREEWEGCWPVYEGLRPGQAAVRYYQEYYAEAHQLEREFPDSFGVFATEELNSGSGVRRIMEFAGIGTGWKGTEVVGIRLNRSEK